MNWTMVGALGEILGAGGVILTLWYLATQLRQSTAASRQAAVRELMDQNTALTSWLNASPDRIRLWMRGMAADPDLSVEEVGQFRVFLLQQVTLWQRLYHLDSSSKAVDSWFVESSAAIRGDTVGSPGFKSWFKARANWIDHEFREVLKREMELHHEYGPFDPPNVATHIGETQT